MKKERLCVWVEEQSVEILLAAAEKAGLELEDYCAEVLKKHAVEEVQK